MDEHLLREIAPFVINFVTYVGFALQIIITEILFSLNYPRKDHYIRRQCVMIPVQLILVFCYSGALTILTAQSLGEHILIETVSYLLILFVSMIGMRLVYAVNWKLLLICAVTSYAVQHIMSQVQLILLGILGEYYRQYFWIAEPVISILFWFLAYQLFAKRTKEKEIAHLQNRNVLFLSVTTILLLLILSCIRDYYQEESVPLVMVTRLFSIMCCIFLLLLRAGYLEQSQMENEMETVRQLNHKERAQYEQNRQNIELINIKCHDLKKRMEQYEDRIIGLTPEEQKEIRDAISIYDTTVKTGNMTLDTILTERSLICEKENIVFSCIADGESLEFLSTGDIYSLFANAIDNAMEAVSSLKNPEERIISLSVRRRMGMVAILVDNYYDAGNLVFQDGLPKTTKRNQHYHGYGMKSIQLIVKKYQGEMNISTDEMFHLSILIPVPDWVKNEK